MAELLPLPLRSVADRFAGARQSPWLRPVVAVGGAVVAVAVLVVVGMAFLRSASPAPRLTLPKAEPGSAPVAEGSGGASGSTVPGTTPLTVTVHVAGAVVHPGVYAVPAGGRVTDAILAAGGPSADGDAEQLNLAAKVSDGDRVYVPKQGEQAPAPAVGSSGSGSGSASASASASGGKAGGAPAGPVDLNAATAEQLEALPGVGPATSKAILAYRSAHGRFRSVTELLDVPGIGPAKLEALRPLVKV